MRKLLIQRILCNHHYINYRNIHGDEINWSGGKRTIYRCIKCGNWKFIDDYIIHGEILYL